MQRVQNRLLIDVRFSHSVDNHGINADSLATIVRVIQDRVWHGSKLLRRFEHLCGGDFSHCETSLYGTASTGNRTVNDKNYSRSLRFYSLSPAFIIHKS